MSKPFAILGIAGGLRCPPQYRSALPAARQLVPEGAVIHLFELDWISASDEDEERIRPPKWRIETDTRRGRAPLCDTGGQVLRSGWFEKWQ
jgi:hypothetical protein